MIRTIAYTKQIRAANPCPIGGNDQHIFNFGDFFHIGGNDFKISSLGELLDLGMSIVMKKINGIIKVLKFLSLIHSMTILRNFTVDIMNVQKKFSKV